MKLSGEKDIIWVNIANHCFNVDIRALQAAGLAGDTPTERIIQKGSTRTTIFVTRYLHIIALMGASSTEVSGSRTLDGLVILSRIPSCPELRQ